MGPKLEDFEVLSTIGSGSHGTVRKVRRRSDGQILVWKELNYGPMTEVEKKGLVLEVNLLRQLNHPHIVRFLHHIVDRRSTTLYILMEHCPGGDLKALIAKCRKTSTFLPEEFVWKVLKQICEALKICHSQGATTTTTTTTTTTAARGQVILHRDIKPANVFLGPAGEVKLGDFGLARTLNSEASFATSVVGTPYYMSPEVIEGQVYNEKSDMWSLGCLLYELCALHPPFQAHTHAHLAAKIKLAKYKPIPVHYSTELQDILSHLLTYQHFLRPTALMLLHHSALLAHFPPPPSDLLSLSISHPGGKKLEEEEEKEKEEEEVNECDGCEMKEDDDVKDYEKEEEEEEERLAEREKENGDIERRETEEEEEERKIKKEQQEDGKLINEVNKTNKITSADGTSHSLHGNERVVQPTPAATHLSGTYHIPAEKPQGGCACGGMSQAAWRERLLSLREADVMLREREIALREREREASIRERKVSAMEREAREHLIRAQIFLRQSRPRQSVTSDLDTTVSADLDEPEVTTARPDPKLLQNPFLEMRGGQGSRNDGQGKHVMFKDVPQNLPFKSSTLDNPKSRKKTGCVFTLARGDKDNVQDAIQGFRDTREGTQDTQGHSAIHREVREGKREVRRSISESRVGESVPDMTSNGINVKGQRKDEVRSKEVISHPRLARVKRSGSGMTHDPARDKENQMPGQGQRIPDLKKPLVTRKGKEVRSAKPRILQFYNVV